MLGAGGVGGSFGAALGRAGENVVLFARGEHLAAIQRNGLTLRTGGVGGGDSDGGDSDADSFTVPVEATDDPMQLGRPDLAIIAVKSYSVAGIAPVAARLAEGGAAVLPLLNGVDAADALARHGVPARSILGGLAMVSASIVAPGVVTRAPWQERIVIGDLESSATGRADEIAAAFRAAGIDATVSGEIVIDLWRKYNMLCAMAAACGLARGTVGAIRDTSLGRVLIQRAVDEIAAVARARGVAIADDQESATMQRIDSLPAAMKPSFVLDVERGGPTELDVLSGAVSRMGRAVNVATPIHDTAAAALASPGTRH